MFLVLLIIYASINLALFGDLSLMHAKEYAVWRILRDIFAFRASGVCLHTLVGGITLLQPLRFWCFCPASSLLPAGLLLFFLFSVDIFLSSWLMWHCFFFCSHPKGVFYVLPHPMYVTQFLLNMFKSLPVQNLLMEWEISSQYEHQGCYVRRILLWGALVTCKKCPALLVFIFYFYFF